MPNINAPFGMWPTEGTGGSSTPRIRKYTVAPGYTTQIGKGSPVILAATGTVQRLITTNTTVFVGVAANHWVSGSGRYDVFVFDDPKTIFEIQADAADIGQEDVGLNYAFASVGTVTVGVNTTTLISKATLASAGGLAAAGSKPMKLIGVSTDIRRNLQNVSWTGCQVRVNQAAHIWDKSSGLGV